jgi:transcription elongation factor SPT6
MLAKARTSKLKSAQMWTENDDDEADEDEAEERLSWSSPTVMAVSHGIGDPRIDRTKVVVLDARGHLLYSDTFDGLNPPRNQHDAPQTLDLPEGVIATPRDREAHEARLRFIALLKKRQPDVVVVTGFSPRTVGLRALVEIMAERAHREMFAASKFSDEDTNMQLAIDVISVHDDVARLYQHSKRGEEEHPSLDVLSRYCVGVARYAQSPLQEFAALTEDELVSLRHDAHQNLLPKERLLLHLERTISAVTNELCVDINRAAHDNYYGALLKHVSGLGPRKAAALVRAIHSSLEGTVVNRDSLLYGSPDSALGQAEETQAILTQKVWHNACAFLTIRTARRQELQGRPDVLDATRIHPQNYRYARFIAFDALRKTEEDKEDGDHESQFCRELLRDDRRRERVQTIDLADYERALLAEQAAKGEARARKLTQLEFIARELVQPCRDERNDYALPTPDDMLTALTGETERTLRNVDVNVTVVNIMMDSIIVRLDSGMEGTINGEYLHLGHEHYERTGQRPPRLRDIVKKDQVLKAQIIDLDKATLRVELTARPDHLAQMTAGGNARAVRPDPKYFNIELDAKARDRAANERRRRTNMRNTRSIVHPNFKNFKAGQAEEYLANPAFEIGTAVVRPSSKGNDHLAVTWKVEEGVYQHIGECRACS